MLKGNDAYLYALYYVCVTLREYKTGYAGKSIDTIFSIR